MKRIVLVLLVLLVITQTTTAVSAKTLTAKQLMHLFIKTPTKDFKAAVLKHGFTFDKQTPVPTYQQGKKGNIKDAYRLYFKQGQATLMLQVLGTDKTNMIYRVETPAQLKALQTQVKRMKLMVKREEPDNALYEIGHNRGIWITNKTNTIEFRDVVYYMDIEIL